MLLVEYILLLDAPITLPGDDNFKLFTDVDVTTSYTPIAKVTNMLSQNTLRWTLDKQTNLLFSNDDKCN